MVKFKGFDGVAQAVNYTKQIFIQHLLAILYRKKRNS
jgi:hypothetical protein